MKFYFFGGCEVQDSVNWLKDNYPEHSYHRLWGTSIGSLLSPRGKVAQSVYDWYQKLTDVEQRVLTNERIYEEIFNKGFISDCLVNTDTYLILSMSYESITRFDDGYEHITYIPEIQTTGKDRHGTPHIENIKRYNFPLKTYEYINDNRFVTSVYDSEYAKKYYRNEKLVEKFAELLYNKFKNNIILVDFPPAKKFYNKKYGLYNDLPKISQFVYKFMEVSKMSIDDYSWKYLNKQVNMLNRFLYQKCFNEKIYHININYNEVIGDDDHYLGRSPFHYTNETSSMIGLKIKDQIDDIRRNQKSIN